MGTSREVRAVAARRLLAQALAVVLVVVAVVVVRQAPAALPVVGRRPAVALVGLTLMEACRLAQLATVPSLSPCVQLYHGLTM